MESRAGMFVDFTVDEEATPSPLPDCHRDFDDTLANFDDSLADGR